LPQTEISTSHSGDFPLFHYQCLHSHLKPFRRAGWCVSHSSNWAIGACKTRTSTRAFYISVRFTFATHTHTHNIRNTWASKLRERSFTSQKWRVKTQ